MGSRRDLVFVTFSVLAFGLLVWLGVWQVERLYWKQDLIARMSAEMASEPRPLAEIEARHAAGEDVEFMPATASGHFLHDAELFVFTNHRGVMGWKVVTPLETTDGRTVLVDRGFIPYDLKEPATRPDSRPDGTLSITGAVRPYASGREPFAPDNDVQANVWHWWDLPAMAEAAGVERPSPFILQADPQPHPQAHDAAHDAAWPQASRPDPALIPNRHLGYALTWFGLAAMLVVVNGLYLLRRRADR
jgi:surfeit locus 1 family protein